MRTIKEYNGKKKLVAQWDSLINNIILPLNNPRSQNLNIVDVQPMQEPLGGLFYFDYQFGDNNQKTFIFWKINVKFKL